MEKEQDCHLKESWSCSSELLYDNENSYESTNSDDCYEQVSTQADDTDNELSENEIDCDEKTLSMYPGCPLSLDESAVLLLQYANVLSHSSDIRMGNTNFCDKCMHNVSNLQCSSESIAQFIKMSIGDQIKYLLSGTTYLSGRNLMMTT